MNDFQDFEELDIDRLGYVFGGNFDDFISKGNALAQLLQNWIGVGSGLGDLFTKFASFFQQGQGQQTQTADASAAQQPDASQAAPAATPTGAAAAPAAAPTAGRKPTMRA